MISVPKVIDLPHFKVNFAWLSLTFKVQENFDFNNILILGSGGYLLPSKLKNQKI